MLRPVDCARSEWLMTLPPPRGAALPSRAHTKSRPRSNAFVRGIGAASEFEPQKMRSCSSAEIEGYGTPWMGGVMAWI